MSVALSPTRFALKLVSAGVKRAESLFRSIGVGHEHPQWQARAEICSRCPLVVVKCGKSYCGRPFLNQVERDEPTEGCGCPVLAKAKDPREHCPRDLHFDASSKTEDCDCMWCTTLRERVVSSRDAEIEL
ncbi:MAG: hypothetical protein QM770_23300 [Tepidisphaeraceae bacterium]